MSLMPPAGASRADIARLQGERLALLVRQILPHNRFYARRFAAAGLDPAAVTTSEDLRNLPFTTKAELLADQVENPPFGSIHTFPIEYYTRYHQTSGTSGQPLRWLDTPESWSALVDVWQALFRIAGVKPGERLFFPFSFGPFLGFWTAFEAASRVRCLCLPGGGMSSTARLRFLLDNRADVVLCTPTYALHLAEVARQQGIDLPGSRIRAVIVAGEPGGSIPATRQRIEAGWGARLFDHNGMTETGPLGIECEHAPGGLHLLETAYVVEVIDSAGRGVPPGTPGELVISSLLRTGSPLIRYRTGDVVCVDPRPCPCGLALVRLDGGIRGRVDDMIVIRGNNLHPSALQRILHRFADVAEYGVEVDVTGTLPVLRVRVEHQPGAAGGAQLAARVDQAIRDELLFRAEVEVVAPGTLPRFEMKSQRVVRKTVPETVRGTPPDPRNC
jgi:phenylacetate-CoA ligase